MVEGATVELDSNCSFMTVVTFLNKAAWSTLDELEELSSLLVISLFKDVIVETITLPESAVVVDFIIDSVIPIVMSTKSMPALNEEEDVKMVLDERIVSISVTTFEIKLPDSYEEEDEEAEAASYSSFMADMILTTIVPASFLKDEETEL